MSELDQKTPVTENDTGKKKKKEKVKKTVGQEILEWVITIVVAVVAALAIRTFIFEPVKVDGHSMDDYLQDNEILFVSKYDYSTAWAIWPFGSEDSTREPAKTCPKWVIGGNPERFDIVICHYPNRGATNFVKRVMGLPGETIEVRDGWVYINGEKIDDSEYINPDYRVGGGSNFGPYPIPEGHFFVMGDHRNNSNDSRAVGAISRDMIVGHAHFVLWPIGNWRSVD